MRPPDDPDIVAFLHTPWHPDGDRTPPVCTEPGHIAPESVGELAGRCREVRLPAHGHVWFGSERPDDRPWLQVGPPDLVSRVVSAVAGQLWVSRESGGVRVMLENLSQNVGIEIRSTGLPESVRLHPVRADQDEGGGPRRRAGTAITALQTDRSTLLLTNRGMTVPIWVRQRVRWGTAPAPSRTIDARMLAAATPGDRRGELAVTQQDLNEAAMRITLAAHPDLLTEFFARPDVVKRLDRSPSLRGFLAASSANRTHHRTPAGFRDHQLQRVREELPTAELHRLILEGLGTPPEHASKYYSEIVRKHLDEGRDPRSARGGSGGGMAELLPRVRSTWSFPIPTLRLYLGLPRVPPQ